MAHQGRWLATGLAAALLAAAPAAWAGANHPRPLAAACSTTFTVSDTGVITIDGTCIATHLGKAAYHATQTAALNPDGTLALDIAGFYTAANGDILRSTLVGTGRFTPSGGVVYTTTETFTGGTGRFADASGTAHDVGVAAYTGPTSGTSSFVSAGSISY
jgi:hypothetical protein